MSRQPIPTWFFALVVVRRGDELLVVHECRHGQLWFLPGGRCEPGEGLVEAALRETLEESGVPVEIEGLLRFEHTPLVGGSRVRAIFVARPVDDTPPKSKPDEHSLEAAWVNLEQLGRLPLRGGEVRRLFEAVAAGAPVFPLSVLGRESEF